LDRKEQKRLEAEQRQARSARRKGQQQLVHKLEKEVAEMEKRQTELTADLEKQETYDTPGRAMQINRELVEVQDRLEAATKEWEEAATRLAEIDATED
jgi:ATP-binding cassette subfamily F protein 3